MAASVTTLPKPTEETGTFLNRIPWYVQMLVLIGLVALLAYGTDMALFSDRRGQTKDLLEKTQVLKQKNAQGNIIRQNLAATQAALVDKRKEIESLQDLLPNQVEISRVYDNIKDFMHEDKLELKRFAETKEVSSDYYTAQPIDVVVSGTYDNLGQFFSRLGFYTRIVSVGDVDIKQAGSQAQVNGQTIEANFVITAYYISKDNLAKLTAMKPAAPSPTATPKPAN
ncbi:MAG TPA: type 4a pilus biogenesis protein PilO [Blastocatellia bacterium]|nr:type 4a pilus biogenesis protein PilO [Blastocatellia bacterium]